MAYVVARSRGALDWFNGQPLYVRNIGKSNGLEYHHIFNQDMLYKSSLYDSKSPPDRQKVNEIANIAYLTSISNKQVGTKKPSEYLPLVLNDYPDALSQQAVPELAVLWGIERFEDFRAERRHSIAESINDFLDD